MTSPHLPAPIVEYFTARVDAAGHAELQRAQAAMSAIYRGGGHSREAVPNAAAALAYAVARMPATYAACVRAFDLAAVQAPGFAPRSLLDIGAGPGTAALAAAAVWPALTAAQLIEPNVALAAEARFVLPLATQLSCMHAALDVTRLSTDVPPADLVTMSYVLAEQPLEAIGVLVSGVAAAVGGLIVIVEPGTPAGYARVLSARNALIANGLHVLAPCPHAETCPLPPADWCHFSVRLQRSAAHRRLKEADMPFEDERFSFVAASRGAIGHRAGARLIRPAEIQKGFADLALCTTAGLATRRVMRRDGTAYKSAKKAAWGDAV